MRIGREGAYQAEPCELRPAENTAGKPTALCTAPHHTTLAEQPAPCTSALIPRPLRTLPPPDRTLQQDQKAASREEFFDSLAAYLTLERAQRLYRFDAAAYNLTEAQVRGQGPPGAGAGPSWWCHI